jgi:hypothetical protein
MVLVGFALLAGTFVPAAQAATGVLMPDVDTFGVAQGSPWVSGPNSASSFNAVLSDQAQPWSPGTDDNRIFTTGNGAAEVGVQSYPLASGEQMVLARAWAFVRSPTGRPLTWELRTGTTTLASGTVAPGSGDGWRSIDYEAGLTQAQVDDLRLRYTAPATGDSSTLAVVSSYVEYETRFAPPVPTITGGPTGTGKLTTPSWTFTADASAVSNQCRVERGTTVVFAWAACSSPAGYTLSGDGEYRFRVRSIGSGGLAGPIASRFYTLDTTPPADPTITSGPSAPSNQPTVSYGFTGDADSLFSCRIERPGFVVSDWGPCSSGRTYELAATMQPDAVYTFSVRATDAATNQSGISTRSFTLDRVKPAPPAITAPSFTKNPLVSGTFTSEPGATTMCQLVQGTTTVVAWTACSSPASYDLSSRADGEFLFSVRATDAAGNVSDTAEHVLTLDRGVPDEPTITSGPSGPTANATAAFGFTGEANATYACRVERDTTVVSDWSACASPRSYTLTTDGPHTFRVRQTDRAGNESVEATRTFTLDRAPPAQPVITSEPTTPAADPAAEWSFTAEAGAFTSCRLTRGVTVISDWTLCSGSASYTGLADGTYTFEVYATDMAGNPGASDDPDLHTRLAGPRPGRSSPPRRPPPAARRP